MPYERSPSLPTIASLIDHIGRPSLPLALDDLLQDIAAFNLSVVFGYPFDSKPLLLYDGYRALARPTTLQAYLDGAYLLDPFYTASVEQKAPGLWRMRDLAPDGFFESEFFHSTEVHPCISLLPGSLVEEIGYLVPLEGGFYAVYSLMRSEGSPFSTDEFARLAALEPLVRQAIRTHWRHAAPAPTTTQPDVDDVLESAFASFCGDQLTLKQRKIVQLILRGHSNVSIGQLMSVTEGTVKIHRHNIYKRLNISSQQELFSLFIRSVVSHG